jgi:uncharacterized protein (DUF305 family)
MSVYAGIVSSLTARLAAVLALASAISLSSCGSPPPDSHTQPTHTDGPVVTGEPAGNNSGDVTFSNNMIAGDQQGIDMSALVQNRSTTPAVVALATAGASARHSDVAILKVLLVQWKENPDSQDGRGQRSGMKGMVDQATIGRLNSLHGSEFDTLWLQSMIGLDNGEIEIANTEVGNGKNVDAIDLAKQIVASRQAEIGQMNQILGG